MLKQTTFTTFPGLPTIWTLVIVCFFSPQEACDKICTTQHAYLQILLWNPREEAADTQDRF